MEKNFVRNAAVTNRMENIPGEVRMILPVLVWTPKHGHISICDPFKNMKTPGAITGGMDNRKARIERIRSVRAIVSD